MVETVFTNAKAGMGSVDKEKVKRVVYEMSKVGGHDNTIAIVLSSSTQHKAANLII